MENYVDNFVENLESPFCKKSFPHSFPQTYPQKTGTREKRNSIGVKKISRDTERE